MTWFELAVWIYLVIGLWVFAIEFYRYDDRRKWLALPVALLFITFLWPWWLLVHFTDRTRKSAS